MYSPLVRSADDIRRKLCWLNELKAFLFSFFACPVTSIERNANAKLVVLLERSTCSQPIANESNIIDEKRLVCYLR
jgi:hypothetical protein